MRPPSGLRGLVPLVLLGAVAFVNALASVITFPLAPFLAEDLAIPAARAALASLVFALAAGLGGLLAALLLGGCERRRVAAWALAGLGLGSAAAALVPSFPALLAARLFSGLCAGPLLAAVLALIPEMVAPARRNQAVSLVVSAYGLALVLGLPMVLALVADGGWRPSFLALAALCLLSLAGMAALPGPKAGASAPRPSPGGMMVLLRQPIGLTGLALIASASFGTLLISPHLGTYALRNLGVEETRLWLIYLLGGGLALGTTQATGWAMDRLGALPAALTVGGGLTLLLGWTFLLSPGAALAVPLLGLVLAGQLARSTVAQASAAQLSRPEDRLTYQCLAAAVTSLAQAAGSGVSALLLVEDAQGRLLGMGLLAGLSMLAAWAAPLLLLLLDRQRRAAAKKLAIS
ncbi:MFS transporter [Teichococcus aerofrigidensis]